MDKYILKHYTNRCWSVGEIYKNSELYANINLYYDVTPEFILIYETEGGTGTGFRKGDIKRKIYIGNSEFEKIETNDN